MRTAYLALLATLLVTAVAGPAIAHHEVGGYDRDHPIVVTGVVREFVWANPHVMLYVEVPNAGRKEEWTLEGAAVSALIHRGWTRKALGPGDRIQVLLAPSRSASRTGQILRVTTGDGHVLSIDTQPDAS